MSTDNVIPVDFGKRYNDSAAALGRLMELAEKQQKEFAADPALFLDRAASRIRELQLAMRSMAEAARRHLIQTKPHTDLQPVRLKTMTVLVSDYERWHAMEQIVHAWIREGLV